MSSIPPEMEESPKPLSDDLDRGVKSNDHIHRWEFESLREDVKAIKYAVIGRHPMRPDPDSLSMRVDAHEKSVAFAHKLSWAALVGTLGLLGKALWGWLISGGVKP